MRDFCWFALISEVAWFDKNAVKVTVSDERKGGGCLEFGVGKVISFLLLGLYKKEFACITIQQKETGIKIFLHSVPVVTQQ